MQLVLQFGNQLASKEKKTVQKTSNAAEPEPLSKRNEWAETRRRIKKRHEFDSVNSTRNLLRPWGILNIALLLGLRSTEA